MFFRLLVFNEFDNYNANHFKDSNRFSEDFYQKYEVEKSDKIPLVNPFKDAEFYTGKNVFNLYNLDYAFLRRGLLVKNQLKKILENFNLAEKTVFFENMKYRVENELNYDLNFMFAFGDISQNVDFSNVTFSVAKKQVPQEKTPYQLSSFSNFQEYQIQRSQLYHKRDELLNIDSIFVPELKKLDLFANNNAEMLTTGIYISDKLKDLIKSNCKNVEFEKAEEFKY